MTKANQLPNVANPRAYQQALAKPAPRKGLVVTMPIEVFHYYRQIHNLDVLGWDGGVLKTRRNVVNHEVKN